MPRFLALLSLVAALLLAGCTSTSRPINPARYAHPVRVACLGDSITFGAGIDHREVNSYPAQLGALLGPQWEVRNFGKSGATLLDSGDKPYRRQPEFAAALAFLPDVVIIKLGTNDTKPQNWAHRDQFETDCLALIRQLRALPSHPRIYLCQPMPAWPPSGWGISPEIIARDLPPLIARIARKEGADVIDLHTPLRDRHDLAPDHVHPNAAGAGIIAREVLLALTDKKPR